MLGFVLFMNKLGIAVDIRSASAFCRSSSVYQKRFLFTLVINLEGEMAVVGNIV